MITRTMMTRILDTFEEPKTKCQKYISLAKYAPGWNVTEDLIEKVENYYTESSKTTSAENKSLRYNYIQNCLHNMWNVSFDNEKIREKISKTHQQRHYKGNKEKRASTTNKSNPIYKDIQVAIHVSLIITLYLVILLNIYCVSFIVGYSYGSRLY